MTGFVVNVLVWEQSSLEKQVEHSIRSSGELRVYTSLLHCFIYYSSYGFKEILLD